MRKIIIGLVISIIVFVSGIGIFTYEICQIKEHKIEINTLIKQTNSFESTEDIHLYTITYLSSIGEVNIKANMIEDKNLKDNEIQITYPSILTLDRDQKSDYLGLDFEYVDEDSVSKATYTWNTKKYNSYYAKNDEVKVTIKYGKNMANRIHLVNDYFVVD